MSNTTQAQTKADASEQPQQQQKPQVLEEDDEFEDFPVEGKRAPPVTLDYQTLKQAVDVR